MAAEHHRRTVLRWASGAVAVGLAGCSGSPGDEESPTDDGRTPPADGETPTDETTTAEPAGTTDRSEPTTTTDDPPEMSTVFHFASGTDEQVHALANVSNLLNDDSTPVEEVVLVANGKGIKLLTESDSQSPEHVRELVEAGVSFRACRNSMAALDVEESELIEGVETVPAGVGELTKLQARDDYAYIETP